MRTFHLVSLGCAKNMVDSELMLGSLVAAGWQFVAEPESAELLLLNTCGFIQPAVEEAIEEILDLARIKEQRPNSKLVVVGCMVQRYRDSLVDELPEVDLFIGTEGCSRMAELVQPLFAGVEQARMLLPDRFLMDAAKPRILATPAHRAWFKITEGCDNRCSYCMIPAIRGRLRSRPVEDLVREAVALASRGVKELSFIAQDITAYGNDLHGREQNLMALLKGVLSETDIPWLRLLYLYPSGVRDELIELVAEAPRILPYFDIPFQHVSDAVLKRMNRHHTGADLYRLIERLRRTIPEVVLRTTFLVGFPGETEEDVEQLAGFLREMRVDHVGIFAYANEEGCPSEHFPGQVPEEEKMARRDWLLELQAGISASIQEKYVGRRELVLVEGVSAETDLLLEGRTRFQAPEVDGCVYINEGTASPGDLVTVEISESQVYDLVGSIVEKG